MDNKIEQFLQEIHSLPDEQIDKAKLESTLGALISTRPDIKADDAFKHKLRTRLSNIIEFKQSNQHVKRFGYLKILLPIFACFIFIVGIFSVIDIKLPGEDTYTPPTTSEDATVIDPELAPEEVANQIAEEGLKQKALTTKQAILEKSRLKRLAEQQGVTIESLSDSEVYGEQNTPVVEETLDDIALPADTSNSTTQLPEKAESEISDDPIIDTSITDILGEEEINNDVPEDNIDDELMEIFEISEDESVPEEDIVLDELLDSLSDEGEDNTQEEDVDSELMDMFESDEDDYDSFELFCKDNLGDILEGEEERSCDLGGGQICSETQVNTNTCEIE